MIAFRLVVPNHGYNKFLTPPPLGSDDKLNLTIDFDILKILQISREQNFISLTFILKKTWYNRLLSYQNLKHNRQNKIFEDDKKMIWTPFIDFLNIENKDKCCETIGESKYIIVPNENLNHTKNSYTEYLNAF